ncbi:MAG: YceI family protein [Chloroflexi bacterium]|nr:YceI family protein [Chloroflexota bacterium]MCI0856683.1 YceI family protein [Chloroflexota bacterium]MCI0890758.1 YceI family protein [Chloroflexota bacterium]
MSIRTIAIGSGLVVAAVVAGIAVWYFAVREDAKLATQAPAIPTDLLRDGEPVAIDGVLTYRIIPEESEAAYFADEQLASLSLPSTAKGATNEIEGVFFLTEDGFALASEPISTFTIDLTSLKSNESRRDTRVQQALETGIYPTATFTIASVAGYDDSIPDGEEQVLTLGGVLDIHGVQNQVTWDVRARRDGNVITALATITFRFDDFGIRPPSFAGFVSVGDDLTLQLQFVAEAV